ncbi:hypothetical protein PR202_ga08266 [Eleusine coracana subsp. coracana]|uniref:Uncharacterized protein n=1 Tax=Eleusine coracana subsp. coracana TaxID=191504 RepID=A0AAV5C2A5_ELECO|nr:hypothetical protein PR202_ga08266 [Eleusine coracana subsp. coracana]
MAAGVFSDIPLTCINNWGKCSGHFIGSLCYLFCFVGIAVLSGASIPVLSQEIIFRDAAKKLKGGSVDLFVVNSFGSAYQLWGVPFHLLPAYIKDGAACFLNMGSLSSDGFLVQFLCLSTLSPCHCHTSVWHHLFHLDLLREQWYSPPDYCCTASHRDNILEILSTTEVTSYNSCIASSGLERQNRSSPGGRLTVVHCTEPLTLIGWGPVHSGRSRKGVGTQILAADEAWLQPSRALITAVMLFPFAAYLFLPPPNKQPKAHWDLQNREGKRSILRVKCMQPKLLQHTWPACGRNAVPMAGAPPANWTLHQLQSKRCHYAD